MIKKFFNSGNELNLQNDIYISHFSAMILSEIERDISPNWDITSNLFNDYEISSVINVKDEGILAWVEEICYILENYFNLKVIKFKKDWDLVSHEKILSIGWSFKNIMKVERAVLNILQRMSWIATNTKKIIDIVWSLDIWERAPFICATRKTLFWMLDKKGVYLGWGWTHRLNLSDAILLKENHINKLWTKKTLDIAFKWDLSKAKFFEIECENKEEVLITANFFKNQKLNIPTIIMFDNFKPSEIKDLILEVKNISNNIYIELSWWINESNVKDYSLLWADIISMWSITHSVKSIDMSLRVV